MERSEGEHLTIAPLLPEIATPIDSGGLSPFFDPLDHEVRDFDARVAVPEGANRDVEPSEVHVHIGRIEVTAVHEPSPRFSKREHPRSTKTLEEYLARPRRAP